MLLKVLTNIEQTSEFLSTKLNYGLLLNVESKNQHFSTQVSLLVGTKLEVNILEVLDK